jgi:hypothetical protein
MDLRRQQKTPTEPGLLGVTDNKEKPDPSLAIADPSTLELTGAPKVRSGVPSGLREPQRAFGPLGPFPPAALTVPARWMTPPTVITPRNANELKRAKQLSGTASTSSNSRFMATISGSAAPRNSSPVLERCNSPTGELKKGRPVACPRRTFSEGCGCAPYRYSIFLLAAVRPSFYFARSVTGLTHLYRFPL